jgi:hypothetical protein
MMMKFGVKLHVNQSFSCHWIKIVIYLLLVQQCFHIVVNGRCWCWWVASKLFASLCQKQQFNKQGNLFGCAPSRAEEPFTTRELYADSSISKSWGSYGDTLWTWNMSPPCCLTGLYYSERNSSKWSLLSKWQASNQSAAWLFCAHEKCHQCAGCHSDTTRLQECC